jgi:5-methylcytosine-specific restriction endonuclease McrA
MSRRPKTDRNKHNNELSKKSSNTYQKKQQNNSILERLGNKTRELANKLIPDKWKTQQPQTKTSKPKKYRKQKIPIALRQACWVRQFGETYQHKCFVDWCHRKISCFDFEVGHNLPESKGGTLDLDNLRPICRQCNIGMGNTYTIDQWRRLNIKH